MYKWIAIIVAFISMVAAIFVVPEVRKFFGLHNETQKTDTFITGTTATNSGVIRQETKKEPYRFAPPIEKDLATKLRGSLTSPSGGTMEFQNLETSRPSFFGDRRTSRTELAVYRRAGEEMALYSIDLRTVRNIEFLGPEKLKTLYGQMGSYMKVKITFTNGQTETTYCGQYDHLYYYPVTESSQAIKVDFMGVQKIEFGQQNRDSDH